MGREGGREERRTGGEGETDGWHQKENMRGAYSGYPKHAEQ